MGSYANIRGRIADWHKSIKSEILQNARRIVNEFDPLEQATLATYDTIDGFSRSHLSAIHLACVSDWLGLRDWGNLVEKAVEAYDVGFKQVQLGALSLEGLGQRHRNLVKVYSGKGIFDFS
ncbi:MAG: hypothetical protein AAFX06_21940 [Planctomycetota bacterium]